MEGLVEGAWWKAWWGPGGGLDRGAWWGAWWRAWGMAPGGAWGLVGCLLGDDDQIICGNTMWC